MYCESNQNEKNGCEISSNKKNAIQLNRPKGIVRGLAGLRALRGGHKPQSNPDFLVRGNGLIRDRVQGAQNNLRNQPDEENALILGDSENNDPQQQQVNNREMSWYDKVNESRKKPAKEIFSINRNAQEALKNSYSNENLTSSGFEVEFAQIDKSISNDILPQALKIDHTEIATSPGLEAFSAIPFKLETDAGRAIEFVTPPLLTPQDRNGQADKGWVRLVLLRLELELRSLVPNTKIKKSLKDIIQEVSSKLGVQFSLAGGINSHEEILYTKIDKQNENDVLYSVITKSGDKKSNSQANIMAPIDQIINDGAAPYSRDQEGEGSSGRTLRLIFKKSQNIDSNDKQIISQRWKEQSSLAKVFYTKMAEVPIMILESFHALSTVRLENSDQYKYPEIREANEKDFKVGGKKPLKTTNYISSVKDKSMVWIKTDLRTLVNALNPREDEIVRLSEEIDHLFDELKNGKEMALANSIYEKVQNKTALEKPDEMLNALKELFKKEFAISEKYEINEFKPEIHTPRKASDYKSIGARLDTHIPPKLDDNGKPTHVLIETRWTSQYFGNDKKQDESWMEFAIRKLGDDGAEGIDELSRVEFG